MSARRRNTASRPPFWFARRHSPSHTPRQLTELSSLNTQRDRGSGAAPLPLTSSRGSVHDLQYHDCHVSRACWSPASESRLPDTYRQSELIRGPLGGADVRVNVSAQLTATKAPATTHLWGSRRRTGTAGHEKSVDIPQHGCIVAEPTPVRRRLEAGGACTGSGGRAIREEPCVTSF